VMRLTLFGLVLCLVACGGDKPHPCDEQAIQCMVNGGEWTSGPDCGTCEYPEIPWEPEPIPVPEPEECLPDVPWCKDVNQQCSTPESPCKTNPSSDPEYCEYAPDCQTPPPAGPSTCAEIAHPDDPRWTTLTRKAQKQDAVIAAIKIIKAECGGDCGPNWIETLRRVAGQLNKMGHCATGPWVDSLALLTTDGHTEEYHPVFSGNGSWTDSGRGKYITTWRLVSEGDPLPLACGGTFAKWNIKCPTPISFNKTWYHCTPLVGPDLAYCQSQGWDRDFCPPRPNGHEERETCERQIMGGFPKWNSDGAIIYRSQLMVRCEGCTWLEICLPDDTNCRKIYGVLE
jgi:hypothetical protein